MATKDRLRELKQRRKEYDFEDSDEDDSEQRVSIRIEPDDKAIRDFKVKVRKIRDDIDTVRRYTERVRRIEVGDKSGELERIMASIRRSSGEIRDSLKMMQLEVEASIRDDPGSAFSRLKHDHKQALFKLFVDTMHDYNKAQKEYQQKCRIRIKRELQVTGVEPTDEQLDQMILEDDHPFIQDINFETLKAKQMLEDVEKRRKEIKELEKSIMDIRDLFVEVAFLIEDQGEAIDRIEDKVINAVDNVDDANNDVPNYDSDAWAIGKKVCLYAICYFVLAILVIWLAVCLYLYFA